MMNDGDDDELKNRIKYLAEEAGVYGPLFLKAP